MEESKGKFMIDKNGYSVWGTPQEIEVTLNNLSNKFYIMIMEYFTIKSKLHFQLINRKFYDVIIPDLMRKNKNFSKIQQSNTIHLFKEEFSEAVFLDITK